MSTTSFVFNDDDFDKAMFSEYKRLYAKEDVQYLEVTDSSSSKMLDFGSVSIEKLRAATSSKLGIEIPTKGFIDTLVASVGRLDGKSAVLINTDPANPGGMTYNGHKYRDIRIEDK